MDIEGAEREALRGATGTLARDFPRLMLDSYHLPFVGQAILPAAAFQAAHIVEHALAVRKQTTFRSHRPQDASLLEISLDSPIPGLAQERQLLPRFHPYR